MNNTTINTGNGEKRAPGKQDTNKTKAAKREKAWLTDRITDPFFTSIPSFYDAVRELYILCMKLWDEQCQQEGVTIEEFIDKAVKTSRTKLKKEEFRDSRYSIYYLLNVKAENAVRKKYHLKKVQDTFFYDKVNLKLEAMLGQPFHKLLNEQINHIAPLDEKLDTKLNNSFANRWLDLYFDIEETVDSNNWQEKAAYINALPVPLSTGGGAHKMFYRAAKFFVDYDPVTGISFYLKHLHADAMEVKKGKLQRFKATYGKMFTTKKQLESFEAIATNLLQSGDLDAALAEAPYIFNKKFAAVELNEDGIKNAASRHAETVQVLNKFLADEEETDTTGKKAAKKADAGILNDTQLDLLKLFHKNKFVISSRDMNSFAKSKGLLKNQLIESTNDACYEKLGDVLIEESGDGYEIPEKYYHKIIPS